MVSTIPGMTASRGFRVLGALCVAALVALVPLNYVTGHDKPWQTVLFAAIAATYVLVGLLIMERRPGNRIGAVIVAFGAVTGGYLLVDGFVHLAPSHPVTPVLAWAVNAIEAPLFVLVAALFLLFPTGTLPSRRWRLVPAVIAIAGPIAGLAPALQPGRLAYYPEIQNPFGVDGFPGLAIGTPAYLVVVGCCAMSAFALVARWRHGDIVERAQLKWAASAALLVGLSMAAYATLVGPGRYNDIFDLVTGIAFGLVPIAIGIAILRYRLYEIDRIISRTVGWAIVSASVAALYLGVVLVLQGTLGGITQGDTLAVAASTLLAAAAFQPLRRRIQGRVDRRFYRARYDAERSAASFADRLRDEVDSRALARELRDAVLSATAPRSVTIWVRDQAR
jgi:hypothetical protein